MRLLILSLVLVSFAPLSHGEESFGGHAPQQLCSLARELGFGGATKYRRQTGEAWSCASTRRTLIEGEPAGESDLRYLVFGSEHRAEELRLELRMRAYRAPRSVLNRFYRYIEKLLKKTLQESPPRGLRETVLSAISGEWIEGGYRMKLEKLFEKGSVYDLWFTVESLPQGGYYPGESKG